MIAAIILEALRTVNLILEGIPVEERQKNYLAFIKFIETLQVTTTDPAEFFSKILAGIVEFIKGLQNV